MSRFLNEKYKNLLPYVPGEQPNTNTYIKLNTNESPYPAPPRVMEAVKNNRRNLRLYSDPEASALKEKLASSLGVGADMIMLSNGSDEALYFAFLAFTGGDRAAAFADLTYGFYPVFAEFTGTPYVEIPLDNNFEIKISDYTTGAGAGCTIFLANPNAPTGIALPPEEIEEIIRANPDNVIVVDEAYVDFGAKSCVPLTLKYDNLLVIRTFSKSRSLAGARIGFTVSAPLLTKDLRMMQYSINPYNVGTMPQAAAIASLEEDAVNLANCKKIQEARDFTQKALKRLGFFTTDSVANFVFAKHPALFGENLYLKLKEQGILIRHFSKDRIKDFNRITIGTMEQMEAFIKAVEKILAEVQ